MYHGDGVLGRPHYKGQYTGSIQNQAAAYGTITFEEGGLLQGYLTRTRDLKITVNCGWPRKELRLGGFTVNVDDTARTGSVNGLIGSNNQYLIAAGDTITTEEGVLIGRVSSINRAAGNFTLKNIPINIANGTFANLVTHWVEKVAGRFIGDVTAGSSVITNCDYDALFPPYVGQRIKIGHSFYELVIDAIAGSNITMSWNADYSKPKSFNPLVGFGVEKFELTTLYPTYSGPNWPLLIPEGAIFYSRANNYGGSIPYTLKCIKAGFVEPAAIGKMNQVVWRLVGDIPPISVGGSAGVSYFHKLVFVDTTAGNVTITVPVG